MINCVNLKKKLILNLFKKTNFLQIISIKINLIKKNTSPNLPRPINEIIRIAPDEMVSSLHDIEP